MDSLFIDKRFVRENEYYFSVFARVWRSEGRKIQKKKKRKFSHQITNKYNFTIKKEKKITLINE